MAVLSFAHLKQSATGKPAITPSPAPVSVIAVIHAPATRFQRPRGIGIMKTALLASVNYCDSCPRFWPADENEKAMGVLYGRCCRDDGLASGGMEVWRVVPVKSRVSQCWYHLHADHSVKKESMPVGSCRVPILSYVFH